MGVVYNFNWRYVSSSGDDTVGWTLPTKDQPLYPYERMRAMLLEVRQMGCSAILLPPSTKGAAGPFSAGYDLFDGYDIGSKNQQGAINTAYGTAEQLRNLVAAAHSLGVDVYGDLVLHQYDGGTADGVYTYAGSGAAGRWPKHASCFTGIPGGVAADVVPNEQGNFGFGVMPSYQNATPAGYMWEGAIANAQWLTRTIGLDGWRVDDAKGTNQDIVYDVLQAEYISDKFAFFEYYDANPAAISYYVNTLEKRRGAALDFQFKFNVGSICNNTSKSWMGALADIGWVNVDASTAMTWVESADTDTSPGEQIIWNKPMAYAIMLTYPGYPMIYHRDYSTDENCYGLKSTIQNLVWIHEKLAQGDFIVRLDTDYQVFAHERGGYGSAPGCTCFFNNDEYNAHEVTIQTKWGPNFQLHNYASCGSVDNVWTDANGNLTVTVQPNDNGFGYLIYAPPGISGGFSSTPRQTEQTFFGAADLDIKPITNGTLSVGRVKCAKGTYLSATLTPADTDAWGNSVQINVMLMDTLGTLGEFEYDDQGENAAQGHTVKTTMSGWHTILIVASGLPAAGTPFELKCDYTAPQT